MKHFPILLFIITLSLGVVPVPVGHGEVFTFDTDDAAYLPGELVSIIGAATPNSTVAIQVLNSAGSSVMLVTRQVNASGVFSVPFKLPADARLGNYTVYVTSGGGNVLQQVFALKPPPLPSLSSLASLNVLGVTPLAVYEGGTAGLAAVNGYARNASYVLVYQGGQLAGNFTVNKATGYWSGSVPIALNATRSLLVTSQNNQRQIMNVTSLPMINFPVGLPMLPMPALPSITLPQLTPAKPVITGPPRFSLLVVPRNTTSSPIYISGVTSNATKVYVYVDGRQVSEEPLNRTGAWRIRVPLATTGTHEIVVAALNERGDVAKETRVLDYFGPKDSMKPPQPSVAIPSMPSVRVTDELEPVNLNAIIPKLDNYVQVASGIEEVTHVAVEGNAAFSYRWELLTMEPPTFRLNILEYRGSNVRNIALVDAKNNRVQHDKVDIIWTGQVTAEKKAIWLVNSGKGMPSAYAEPFKGPVPRVGQAGFKHELLVPTDPGATYKVNVQGGQGVLFKWELTSIRNYTVPMLDIREVDGKPIVNPTATLQRQGNLTSIVLKADAGSQSVGLQLWSLRNATTLRGDKVWYATWRVHSLYPFTVVSSVNPVAQKIPEGLKLEKNTYQLGDVATVSFKAPGNDTIIKSLVLTPGRLDGTFGRDTSPGFVVTKQPREWRVSFKPTEPDTSYTLTVTLMGKDGELADTVSFIVEAGTLGLLQRNMVLFPAIVGMVLGGFLFRRFRRRRPQTPKEALDKFKIRMG